MRDTCAVCGADQVVNRLDLGAQPICNRFLKEPHGEEHTHPLVLGQCARCGLIQMLAAAPARALRPRHDWIAYSEPEGHLDELVARLCGLPGIHEGSVICGLSRQDDSTLRRFRERGYRNTWRIDPVSDLGITVPHAGVETIQDFLTTVAIDRLGGARPRPAIVVARYLLEHLRDPAGVIAALRRLAPSGYLVFEVPDCELSVRNHEYSMIWEEHTLYCTPETCGSLFSFFGMKALRAVRYPHPHQHALVIVVRTDEPASPSWPSQQVLDAEIAGFASFAAGLPDQRARVTERLAAFRRRQGRIALLGAGHAACVFINLLGLGDLIEFVADDNPHKTGLFMPGSRLPIRPSSDLLDQNIRLCLMAVSAESEERVLQGQRQFLEQGGLFASIFPLSRHALTALMDKL